VVAIKLIHPHLADNREFIARFEEEAAAVARLRHPSIVQVYDFDHDGDVVYMVLEFVAGETLSQRVQRLAASGRQLPVAEAVQAISQACDAVDYAHQRGLVHRDIKPANIMIDIHGQAILMDFGIVKILGGDRHTATGAVFGTAHYMSPEQVRGMAVDHRADIYALGVTLYEILGGRPPFSAESVMTIIMMHLTDAIPDICTVRTDVPPAIRLVIERAMAKDVALRYQSAAAMAADLRAALAGAPPAAATDRVTQAQAPQLQGAAGPIGPSPAVPAAALPMPTSAAPAPRRPTRALLLGAAVGLVGIIIAIGAAIAAMGAGPADGSSLAKGRSATQTSLAGGGLPPTSTAAAVPTATIAPTEPPTATVVPTRSAPTVAPAATVVPTEPPTATVVPTEPPTATVVPTEPPAATVVPALSVRIDAISVDSYTNRYVVEYATYADTEQLPGVHVHFFFDTVAPENAGLPGSVPWIVYGGPRPFTGYALADRPRRASQLCALVANEDHSFQPGSGNCVALP
jgi:serine/threonine-protein kinase